MEGALGVFKLHRSQLPLPCTTHSGSVRLSSCTKSTASFLNVSGMILSNILPSRNARIWGASDTAYSGHCAVLVSDAPFGSSVATKRTK